MNKILKAFLEQNPAVKFSSSYENGDYWVYLNDESIGTRAAISAKDIDLALTNLLRLYGEELKKAKQTMLYRQKNLKNQNKTYKELIEKLLPLG